MIEQEKPLLKKIFPHVIAIFCFIIITAAYFSPILQGKVLQQGDVHQYIGSSQELKNYYDQDKGISAWTGSLFSGMPSYHITYYGTSTNFFHSVETPIIKVFGNTGGALLVGMVMAYILFCIMGMSPILALLGAIAYGLTSYNIIILEAGHITKAWAIAYMPIVIAGLMKLYQKKLLLGSLLFLFGLAFQITWNHIQITYYTGLLCLFLYIGLVIKTIRDKHYKFLAKATGLLFIALIIALLTNAGRFYGNYIMSKESIRGSSDLKTNSNDNKKANGLDKDYAFAWSYGKAETFSLLVPNIEGGSSNGLLSKDSHLAQELEKQGHADMIGENGIQSSTYWGDQPFTSGPVYFGAIICFLFIMGMVLIRSRIKWVLLIATVFFIFLSWGNNLKWFNYTFFDFFPYYNKFRTVSMALVIPSLTMVMLAIWGVKEFIYGAISSQKKKKALYISAGITAFISLILWLIPGSFFNFISPNDVTWKAQVPSWYYNALLLDREAILSSDAFRSLVFIIIAAIILLITLKSKSKKTNIKTICSIIIVVLVLIDLWNVDKRYLNDTNFQDPSYQSTDFPKSTVDKIILQDKTLSYRVLNLNNPFNDATTSFYHKSIGGYSAVKLKRYQNLIDFHLTNDINNIQIGLQKTINQLQKENKNTADIVKSLQEQMSPYFENTEGLNMLNDKYIIYNPQLPPLVNPYALGNAWFVDEYKIMNTPNDEIDGIGLYNMAKTAIIGKDFANKIKGLTITSDPTATISLTSYKPNILTYKVKVSSEQLAVFSEIYFADGWKVYIDGKKSDYLRADWTLRALRITKGEHTITFKFYPTIFFVAEHITSILTAIMLIALIAFIIIAIKDEIYKKSKI